MVEEKIANPRGCAGGGGVGSNNNNRTMHKGPITYEFQPG